MSEEEKAREEEVLKQSVSLDELEAAAGGEGGSANECVEQYNRRIHRGRFPNCAATVEDGSWCGTNDACVVLAVYYEGREHCGRAWK